MLWFFGRGNQTVQIQTSFDNDANEYVLEIAWPDRVPQIERFREVKEFEARIAEIEQRLKAESWTQQGGPEILSEGWRGPINH